MAIAAIRGGEMSETQEFNLQDKTAVREMLLGCGYADKAIDYYLEQRNMGSLPDASQISELTGHCGDTMKIFLIIEDGRIRDARYQVLGCPGAIAAAMAAVDLVRGKTLDDALELTDRDVFRELEDLPDQKQHCIRLAVKTLRKGIQEYKDEPVAH